MHLQQLALVINVEGGGGGSSSWSPALYVFGDSTADVGNNNYINTTARANFYPNGLDFPRSKPTGRFSNAYNGIDFIASHMGLKRSPPPYLSLVNKTSHHLAIQEAKGLNFASGGSGILDSTGTEITLTQQIHYFSTVRSNLATRLSVDQLDGHLSRAVFLISAGGNDIIDYFAAAAANGTTSGVEVQRLISSLISKYKDHVQGLYSLGARKFGIIGAAPLGCCPRLRIQTADGGCVDALNEVARMYNRETEVLFQGLAENQLLPGLHYSIGSPYNVIMNIISNPGAVGFTEVKAACCGGGTLNAEQGCSPAAAANLCSNRGRHLFWDFLHPTHRTSKLAGLAIYSGSTQFASPINFRQLVELNLGN